MNLHLFSDSLKSPKLLAARLKCKIDCTMLKLLKLKYGFDDWYAINPPSTRPYKKFVAHIINKERPKVVVEVGCGLGDILSLIHADKKYGIDHSPEVIAAAQSIDRQRKPLLVWWI